MTSAGNIKLGVEIDADDLSSRLGEAVRRAIAPALERVQAELQKVQREYDKTGRAAAESSAAQVESLKDVERQAAQTAATLKAMGASYGGVGAASEKASRSADKSTTSTTKQKTSADSLANAVKRVTTAQNELNAAVDIFGKKSPEAGRAERDLSKAHAAHTQELLRAAAESRASTDSQIHDYERLARAAEESAAKQRAAQAASGGGGPPRGGGGSGGEGGRGGGGRGGVLGFLTGPTGLNVIAQGVAAMPALATGVVNVVGAVQQLAQAGGALPGIFAGGAASIGTAVIGLHGMKDAVKALNDAADDPKKQEAANKALADMAPAAAATAKAISGLTQGPLKDFQKSIAQPMLDGVADQLTSTADKVIPRVQPGMQKIAGAWNNTIKTALSTLGDDKNLGLVDRILGNTAEGQTRATNAIKPIVDAGLQFTKISSDFLPRLGDAITKVATRFDAFVSKNAANGNIFRWIDEGLNGARSFGDTLLNLGKILTGLTHAAGEAKGSLSGDGGLLGSLERVTGRWSDFVNSTQGQDKIGSFFKGGTDDLHKYGDLLKELWPVIEQIVSGFSQWGEVTFPIIKAIADLVTELNKVPGLLQAIVVGFLAYKTLSPFAGLLGDVAKLDGALGSTGGGGILGKLGGLKSLGVIGGAGLAVSGATDQAQNGVTPTNAVETIGGAALLGLSVGGPWGAAIGALVGAGVTLFERARKQIDDGKAEWEKSWQEHHDAGPNREGSPERALAANPALQGVMNPSLFNPDGSAKPTIQQSLGPKLAAGQLPGFSVGPDGQIIGPNGQPVNLPPGLLPPNMVKAPPPPVLPPSVQAQVTQGTPIDAGAAAQNTQLMGTAQAAKAAFDNVQLLSTAVQTIPSGEVVLKDNSAEAIKHVQDLGYTVQKLPNGQIAIAVTYMNNGVPISLDQLKAPIRVGAVPGDTYRGPGRATGGPIFGGIKGVDSVPIMAQHGEFVLDTGDVARMGGVGGVEAFRQGLESGAIRTFADGGPVIGSVPGLGPLPGPNPASFAPIGPENELSVLMQIRDLLAGKGGTSNPIAATAANTGAAVTAATKGTAGTKIGPFGTPVKEDTLYDRMSRAISAIGGDPEKIIGADPATYQPAIAAGTSVIGPNGLPMTTAGTPGAADFSAIAAALSQFAKSGDLSTVSGVGLNANSPVITGLTSARNKKKGGLSDDDISGLVDQIVGGGGYTGTLDPTNTPVVKSLQRYRDQLVKQGGGIVPGAVTPSSRGTAAVAGVTGVPTTPLPAGMIDPVSAFAAAHSGGKYVFGASDLSKGLSDCTGAVSDLVEVATKGQADPGRLFSTSNEGSVLTSLGAVQGLVPGMLQIGFKNGGAGGGHSAATLPNGVNFESGGGTGQGATYGGAATGAADPQFTDHYSLPVSGAVAAGLTGVPGMTGSGLPGAAGGAGTPVYVTNWPGQGGGIAGLVGKQALGAGIDAAGAAAGDVGGDIAGALPAAFGAPKTTNYADLSTLTKEGNPLALANALGINIDDFTRQGGGSPQTMSNQGPGYDANGQLFSDTASLIDRTFTSLNAQLQAMKEQMVDAIKATSDKLDKEALQPIVKDGIQSALDGLKDTVTSALGGAIGTAAGPPIADAVGTAVSQLPIDNSGAGGGNLANPATLAAAVFASGGPVTGGVPGKDSVPAWLMPNEHVFTSKDVARMGGQAGVMAFRAALQHGPIRKFADGGGVTANDTVGADFFGVSQVPIIGAIVNMLVRVLLKVIGVDIQSRDTMVKMSDDFRSFRGDAFKAFDAQGRLLNDTSGLLDRSSTSDQTAADERIRILKIVIQAIIKYLIEKVIVPIAKAVANAAIQAGGSAAGAFAGPAGGIVSSLISSAGSAGVDIAGEVGTDFALAISSTLIDVVSNGLQSLFPSLTSGIFSGAAVEGLFGPLTKILTGFLGIFTGILGGGAFGGASTLIPGVPFDSGGMAHGVGYLPKATMDDELVLSPGETDVFNRFVAALENGGFSRGGDKTVHAPITVIGGRETATQVQDRLLKLLS